MPFTEDYYLPSPDELKVQEVNLTTPYLKAGALHFGRYCDEQCKEFMLCRKEYDDPRKCVNEGKDVTACAIDFFQKVKKDCKEPFDTYANCLDWSSSRMELKHCRKTQAALDKCMFEKLDIERPYIGYFTEIRTHKTDRPKPGPIFPRKEYKEDAIPSLPADYPKERSKYGANYYFFS